MADLTLFFTGVNGYAFPQAVDEPLTVVMPNATQFGASPLRTLPPHLPSLWRPGSWPLHCLWEQLTIDRLDATNRPVRGWQKLPYFPGTGLEIDRVDLDDPLKVAATVSIYAGGVSRYGPCRSVWTGGDGSEDDDALIHTLRVDLTAADGFRLTRRNLFTGAEVAVELTAGELMIGNVCGGDILGWPANNDRPDLVDHDFEWIYVVAAASTGQPLPTIAAGHCGYLSTDPVDEQLKARLDARFASLVGGGGCGCECGGCKIHWKAE